MATRRVRDNPPGAPSDLRVDSATHDGVALSWSAPSHRGLTGYRILRGSAASALETIVADTGDLSRSYTDTTAADDATHHYAVLALSLDGDGRQSATVSATTPPRTPEAPVIEGAPAAPAGLTARLDGTGGVTLGWTRPGNSGDDAVTGYRILRGDDARSMRVIVEDTASAAVSYSDPSLAANQTQVYAVQARNAAGLSQLSNMVSITTLGPPTALGAFADPGSVSLIWTPPDSAGITGYQVLRGSTAQNLQPLGESAGSAETFHADLDVSPETTYHYAVRARSVHGAGPLSGTFSVTTPPRLSVLRFEEPDPDEEPLIAQQQQADPCANPRIESMSGRAYNWNHGGNSATEGSVHWEWTAPANDAPTGGTSGCRHNFRLSYSDDYGVTFTEAAVLRELVWNMEFATYEIGGTTHNRNRWTHHFAVPNMSIISALRIEVDCDSNGENCAHTMDSTDAGATFEPNYHSSQAGMTSGADTKAVLVPSNYASSFDNASAVRWLWYTEGTEGTEDPHVYRIQMTAGKTYIFDETYRKWAMMSGGWRDGEHFYLPDEIRLSLYTKNSAGELVEVSDFQDQPKDGWQAIYDDGDYQGIPSQFSVTSFAEYLTIVDLMLPLFGGANNFPLGSRHRNACIVSGVAGCGIGLDIQRDDGRQLRFASYAPTQSGIYYLKVTRIRDDQPKFVGGFWELPINVNEDLLGVYANAIRDQQGLRSAFPYYEISVEVRGPTLSLIAITGDSAFETYTLDDDSNFGFLPGRFDYRVGVYAHNATVTVAATAVHSDATVTITPADADTATAGHQINPVAGAVTDVTFTVSRGDDSEDYTIELSRP